MNTDNTAGSAPFQAHSKSEYKRLSAQGADVLPPAGSAAPAGPSDEGRADAWLLKVHAHLQEALRIPTMPWPDPGAHGHEATARAIHASYCALRFKVIDAIAELTATRVAITGLLADRATRGAAGAEGMEQFAWESTTPGYARFVTQKRYEGFSPAVQKWYRPICQKCAAGDRGALSEELTAGDIDTIHGQALARFRETMGYEFSEENLTNTRAHPGWRRFFARAVLQAAHGINLDGSKEDSNAR